MAAAAYILGALFLLGGLGSCVMAKGAIHEVGSLVSLLIGFGLIMSAAVIEKLSAIHKELRAARDISETDIG